MSFVNYNLLKLRDGASVYNTTNTDVLLQVKFHLVPGSGLIWEMGAPLRGLFIILGVIVSITEFHF